MNKLCPNCKKPTDSIKSIIVGQEIKTGCNACLYTLRQGSENAAKGKREHQRTEYRRDITQPINPREYIKAYPEKAREAYSDETLRKYS